MKDSIKCILIVKCTLLSNLSQFSKGGGVIGGMGGVGGGLL